MTQLEKINKLTWYDLLGKLKDILLGINSKLTPTPPTTGTYTLQSVNGVLTWVEVV